MALEKTVIEDGEKQYVCDGKIAGNIDGIGCLMDEMAERQSFESVLSDQ